MVTVRDLQRAREQAARVNHETYKQLLRVVQDRLRARAENKGRDLVWQVPPFVPGRPVYKTWHAARYVSDKLRLAGFQVTVATPATDVHVLHITWDPVPRRPPPPAPRPPSAHDDVREQKDHHQKDRQLKDRQLKDRHQKDRHQKDRPDRPDRLKVDVTEAARRVENLKARLRVG